MRRRSDGAFTLLVSPMSEVTRILSAIEQGDPHAARVVELHHFAGMTHEQVAAALNMSVYLARQKWTFARAWLKTTLGES